MTKSIVLGNKVNIVLVNLTAWTAVQSESVGGDKGVQEQQEAWAATARGRFEIRKMRAEYAIQ